MKETTIIIWDLGYTKYKHTFSFDGLQKDTRTHIDAVLCVYNHSS